MSFVSRGTRAAARPLRRSIQCQPRRYDSHQAGHGHDAAHHGESALHVAPGPANESFGKGFYFALATIPLFAVVYSVASSPGDNFVERMVKNYKIGQEAEEKKNVAHTTLLEQAAADRQLFASQKRDTRGPDLKFPEAFNFGSPYNISAGQGSANLSALVRHYDEKEQRQEEARLRRMKDGRVVSAYD